MYSKKKDIPLKFTRNSPLKHKKAFRSLISHGISHSYKSESCVHILQCSGVTFGLRKAQVKVFEGDFGWLQGKCGVTSSWKVKRIVSACTRLRVRKCEASKIALYHIPHLSLMLLIATKKMKNNRKQNGKCVYSVYA